MLFFSLMCIFDIFVKVAVGVGLCLSPLSCPADLSICVCAMLFVLLWLYSIQDQEWLPTLVFFYAGLSGLSCLVCLHTKFKNFFPGSVKKSLIFGWYCIEPGDYFW